MSYTSEIINNKQKNKKTKKLNLGIKVIHSYFIIYTFLCLFPLFLIFSISFTDETSISRSGYHVIPKQFSTYAYEFIFKEGEAVIRSYIISIFVTIVGTITGLFVLCLYAYPLSRNDFKYKNIFTFYAFFTFLFNAGIVPWYMVIVRVLHLKNNLLVYFLPYLMNAWFLLIMRTFYKSIPDSIIESAKIDGAGEYRIFFSIIVPLSIPGIATIGLFYTILFWNDFYLPLLFIDDKKLYNLQFLMYRVQMNIQYISAIAGNISGGQAAEILKRIPSRSAQMAMAILSIGPIALAYPYFQKYFVKGLTIGSLKG